jgi:hypothetical protein
MSDVQLYLFEFDKNKKEATAIAENSAKSKIACLDE